METAVALFVLVVILMGLHLLMVVGFFTLWSLYRFLLNPRGEFDRQMANLILSTDELKIAMGEQLIPVLEPIVAMMAEIIGNDDQ